LLTLIRSWRLVLICTLPCVTCRCLVCWKSIHISTFPVAVIGREVCILPVQLLHNSSLRSAVTIITFALKLCCNSLLSKCPRVQMSCILYCSVHSAVSFCSWGNVAHKIQESPNFNEYYLKDVIKSDK
jgi:hypothetical protein